MLQLQLIRYALFAYQSIVELSQGEIKEDDALLLSIKQLRERISEVKVQSRGELSFLITVDDLVIVLSALTALIDILFILLPQSQERDDVIKVYESLRSYLTKLFFGHFTLNNEKNSMKPGGFS